MSIDWINPVDRARIPDDILTRIDKLEALMLNQQANDVSVLDLAELAADTGAIAVAQLYFGTGDPTDPTTNPTGVFLDSTGINVNGTNYNLLAYNAAGVQTLAVDDQGNATNNGGTIPAVLAAFSTENTATNTTATIPLWAATLPGGKLGVGDCVIVNAYMSILNNSGAGRTYDFIFKLGGSAVITLTSPSIPASATPIAAQFRLMVKNSAANLQKMSGSWLVNNSVINCYAEDTLDLTVDQGIGISVHPADATATQVFTTLEIVLEYFKTS